MEIRERVGEISHGNPSAFKVAKGTNYEEMQVKYRLVFDIKYLPNLNISIIKN
jgi:hypothetical protein